MSPLLIFVAMALADDVFRDVHTMEQILDRRPPAGQMSETLTLRKEAVTIAVGSGSNPPSRTQTASSYST